MALKLITAEERLQEHQNKDTIVIFGVAGIGKTSLIRTLPPHKKPLVLDMEAGLKSVQDCDFTSISVRTWIELAEIGCLIAGPDLTAPALGLMSEEHCAAVLKNYNGAIDLSPFRTLFMDSITEMSRMCAAWAKTQPDAWVIKDGQATPNNFGYFGLISREMIRFLKHMQRAPGLDVIFVGILEKVTDDFGRTIFQPQLEGAKTARELPGIVNQVIYYDFFDFDQTGTPTHAPSTGAHRAMVCKSPNPFGFQAKDRSGLLDMMEPPDLGKLFQKLNPARTQPNVVTLPQPATGT